MIEEDKQWQLDIADYVNRLCPEENRLTGARSSYRFVFVGLAGLAVLAYGALGVNAALIVLALIPLFLLCVSVEFAHDRMVLRRDTRGGMKRIARRWNLVNHDMSYSKEAQKERGRWYHGLFEYARCAEYVSVDLLICGLICWYSLVVWHLNLASLGVMIVAYLCVIAATAFFLLVA